MTRLLVVFCLAALAACSAPAGPEDDLAAARARWAAAGLRSYAVTVQRSCECLPDMTGPVIVEVRDGRVESRRYQSSGTPVASAELAAEFPSVEELFAKIEAALARPVAKLEARYDQRTGAPRSVAIDYDARMADDEVIYTVGEPVAR